MRIGRGLVAVPDGENMLSRGRGERGHVDSSNAFGLNPVCPEVMRGKGRQENCTGYFQVLRFISRSYTGSSVV